MRIAVIGGGLFGCAIAAQLKTKHDVHLFEEKDSILRGASFANQYRLHRGYHYPRSPETMVECRVAAAKFASRWPEAVHRGGRHIYAIARDEESLPAKDYLDALSAAHLHYTMVPFGDILNPDTVELAIEVEEDWVDISALRGLLWKDLRGVTVHLNARWGGEIREGFDLIVIAAYANTNLVAGTLGCPVEIFQYEVVEKPVIQMPDRWQGLGVVIMDGPFCSVDPFGADNRYHVMGHVERAVRHRNTDFEPEPTDWDVLNNRGVISTKAMPPLMVSRCGSMTVDGSRWMPDLMDAKHIGSMFTVRAVLPNVDDTDERPTIVTKLDEKVVRVFSGKLAGCIQAAEEVEEIADDSGILVGRSHAA